MAQGQVVGCDGNEIWWACINRGDFLIEVYRRVSEDWRYYDRLLWEVPFGTIAGSSLVVALTKLLLGDEAWMSIAVLLALQILILVMTHLTIKVRYFSIERAECVKEIERNCIETFIPYETREAWRALNQQGNQQHQQGNPPHVLEKRTIDIALMAYAALSVIITLLIVSIIASNILHISIALSLLLRAIFSSSSILAALVFIASAAICGMTLYFVIHYIIIDRRLRGEAAKSSTRSGSLMGPCFH